MFALAEASTHTLGSAVLWATTFGLIGIAMIAIGYKVFDLITPGIRVEHELAEQHNIAVAIVIAALILGIAIVTAVAIGS